MCNSKAINLTATLILLLGMAFAPVRVQAAEIVDRGPEVYGPHEITERWGEFQSDALDGAPVRYYLAKPNGSATYPGIFYVYGRPGLDDRLFQEIRRLASSGFVVFVVHFQEALMIPVFNPRADPPEAMLLQTEGFNLFLKSPERQPGKVCVVGVVRGSIYAVNLASRPETACYIGLHAVISAHENTEQLQDTTILPSIRKVRAPTLLMIGNADFEVRIKQSVRAAQYLRANGVPAELVVYPGAARGFDFRILDRALADDLAKSDSMHRMTAFIRHHTDPKGGNEFVTIENAIAPQAASVRAAPFTGDQIELMQKRKPSALLRPAMLGENKN